MKIEILHVRDPDSECTHTLFINGEEVTTEYDRERQVWVFHVGGAEIQYVIEDVDAGRGYDEESWEENIQGVRDSENMSDAFRAATLAAMGDPPGGEYIVTEW